MTPRLHTYDATFLTSKRHTPLPKEWEYFVYLLYSFNINARLPSQQFSGSLRDRVK